MRAGQGTKKEERRMARKTEVRIAVCALVALGAGCSTANKPFLTGVVFSDANASGEYDAGEGLAGVTVQVMAADGTTVTTTTKTAGGYCLEVENPGSYTVTVSGAPLTAPVSLAVNVQNANVKVDVMQSGANFSIVNH